MNVVVSNNVLSLEVVSPFSAFFCGFETIVPKTGTSLIELEPTDGVSSKKYYEEYKLNKLIESSYNNCPVDETSY